MKRNSEGIRLDLAELIHMNQLVRAKVDLEGFQQWYKNLNVSEQSTLLCNLHLYAQQAGYDDQTISNALASASLQANDPIIDQVLSFRGGYSIRYGDEDKWLIGISASMRFALLTFLVFLFAQAERNVRINETRENCNHWWHRDLLNENVVQAILHDPYYYRTAMKDDAEADSEIVYTTKQMEKNMDDEKE